MLRRRTIPFACLAAFVLLTGCADPPSKEIDRAQGAIDAARAAGAEQYAATEYQAATTALKNATDAVAAGDYRLALNYALDSHEHAQSAARDTANTKARIRADVQRTLAEIDALAAQARARLRAAERARVPQRFLRLRATELAAAQADLQKARTAADEGDYTRAGEVLKRVRGQVEKTLGTIESRIRRRR